MRIFLPVLLAASLIAFGAHAQTPAPAAEPAAASQPVADADLAARAALAAQVADLTPPRASIEMAIDAIANSAPVAQRREIRSKMLAAFDFAAFRQAAIDTMAQTFTEPELRKMLEYQSSPEAKSIAQKMPSYETKIQPQMTKMLDVALMVARTGKPGKVDSAPQP